MKQIDLENILNRLNAWVRFEMDQVPIYIDPEYPNWVAVNRPGDQFIHRSMSDKAKNPGASASVRNEPDLMAYIRQSNFLSHFPVVSSEPYQGRSHHIKLSHLDECWLHITDKCNQACRHCLFSCSPKNPNALSLSLDDIQKCVDETYESGARVFYLTGGEPFVHHDITAIMETVLNAYPDTSLVMMTNGIPLPKFEPFLRTLPQDRLFFQVSAEGIGEVHDKTRGAGSFHGLIKGLESLKRLDTRNTIAMTVTANNLFQMKDMIDLAKSYSVDAVHYMWLIIRGEAAPDIFVDPGALFSSLADAWDYAEKQGIEIDNIKNIESQVFSPPGTRYDLGNAGWRSIAIGPDKHIYPTAAMIHEKALDCGSIAGGIETVWKTSEILNQLRNTSLMDSPIHRESPLKYLTGGGDIDHGYFNGARFEGYDPYTPLYEKLILRAIAKSAKSGDNPAYPRVLLKMGDKLRKCHSDGDGVSLTHSNCVLTFSGTRQTVGDFYTKADSSQNDDIINPVCYPETEISHIPDHSRIRSYGCGSPVLDGGIQPNETVVDLGSGAGVECFIAARKTGEHGKVYGVDMLDHMLARANRSLPEVMNNLGYRNIEFRKGFLEAIPLDNDTADLVASNCVINLSEDKRMTFKEIFRILKPGGRIVISDVVTDTMSPPSIQNDPRLQGECIAGAMIQTHLFAMLEFAGFTDISILKRFFYRHVKGHDFFSLTYRAYKPGEGELADVVYPGPYAAVVTDGGDILIRGRVGKIKKPFHAEHQSPHILVLDSRGNAANIDADNACCAYMPPSETRCCAPAAETGPDTIRKTAADKINRNCMVCGEAIEYLKHDEKKECWFCSREIPANAVCRNGHFVCDSCHGADALAFANNYLTSARPKDLIAALNVLRSHPSFNLHGPEHHYAIAGLIPSVYKNLGGVLTRQDILTAIERGTAIPGGSCAFWGGCGAALGAGIGFAVILDSNPLKPKQRQIVQSVISVITGEMAAIKAARCCQRECWLTLRKASELSERYLDIKLPAGGRMVCGQMDQHKECVKTACPFYDS